MKHAQFFFFASILFWANSLFPQTQPLAVFWLGSIFGFCSSTCCFDCVFAFLAKSVFRYGYFRSLALFRLLVIGLFAHSGEFFQQTFLPSFCQVRLVACAVQQFSKNWLVSRASLLSGFSLSNFRVHFPASERAFSASSFLGLILCPTRRAGGRLATFRFAAFFRSKSFLRFVNRSSWQTAR